MTEQEAHVAFAAFPGVGPLRFKLLIDYFGSAEKAWAASEKTFLEIGLGNKLTRKLVDFRKTFNAESYVEELLQQEIKIFTRIDPEFPVKLKEIPDPPIALFVKGKLSDEKLPHVGVVGTRKPTTYGKDITTKLTRDLALSGCVIVSGMARGVDGIAHRAALEVGAPTVAVLGCGVDIIYPPEHKDLYRDIIEKGGAIVSEVPPGHTVLKGLFPARNRIISGLSLGVLVTEGAEDSGSLITARYAAEQGREVFAVPGPITSYLSAGPTKLIKSGAKLVTEVEDILGELKINPKSQILNSKQIQISKSKFQNGEIPQEAAKIFSLLSANGEMHYDEIIRESGLATATVGAILTQLELAGIIRGLGNGKYSLVSS